MKPVAIFRHSPTEGPGYFATYLARHRIDWRIIAIDDGEPVPSDPYAYSGLVFMGGPMSVNDELAWIAPLLQLIRAAIHADVPVLGHCLGGQLMSKALGGTVARNAVTEIGWGEVEVMKNDEAAAWFGHVAPRFTSFHWHGETFSIPAGATRVLVNANCGNQAFVIGKHLGMQCHIEMTPEMIESWCVSGAAEIAGSASPAVQPVDSIKAQASRHLPALRAAADGVYDRWIRGLKS